MAHNPYLEEFRRLLKGHESPYYFDLELRHDTIMQYAWAIPNEPALKALAGYRKIVEIGAGGGYWAHLLAQRGAEVACYDLVVPPSEWAARQWHPIHIGGPERAADHPEAALLLCWPPLHDPMADQALAAYNGRVVAYVGEGEGAATGDAAFHERLERGWMLAQTIAIPQWPGMHDYLFIYHPNEE